MIADQPPRPANIQIIVAINQGRRPLTLEEPRVERLSPEEARERFGKGLLALDTRSPEAFGAGHVAGAMNVQLSSAEFEQRAGWMLPADGPVVLIPDGDEAAQGAIRKLAFVGLDQRVRGYVEMEAWESAGLPTAALPQITVAELRDSLAGGIGVLDVRETSEWQEGHIASATHMNFKHLPARLGEVRFGREDRIAVICATGMRSSTACSYLLRNGFRNLLNVMGGMGAWQEAGYPTSV